MTRLAARQSAFGTAVQVVPQLRRVLANLRPTWHVRHLAALDAAFLIRHEITALIWDVDGTLTVNQADRVAEECLVAFEALTSLPELTHAILSNAGESRYRQLGRIFPGIPVYKGYRAAGEVFLRIRIGDRDSWNEEELATRLATDIIPIRKPNAELVRRVVTAIGHRPQHVVMVGDQYLTDIAGANLAGVRSIKLPTIAGSAFPLAVRAAQQLEGLIYRLGYGAPVWEEAAIHSVVAREGR